MTILNTMKPRCWTLLFLVFHLQACSTIAYAEALPLIPLLQPSSVCVKEANSKQNSSKHGKSGTWSWPGTVRFIAFLILTGLLLNASETKDTMRNYNPQSGYGNSNCLVPSYVPQQNAVYNLADQINNILGKSKLVAFPRLPTQDEFECEIDLLTHDTGVDPFWRFSMKNKKSCVGFGLDFTECSAIYHYTVQTYRKLNENLRKHPVDKVEFWAFEAMLSKALNKLPAHEGWTLRRDRSLSPAEARTLFCVGEAINFSTFISTTKGSAPLDEEFSSAQVVFKIHSKSGRSIKDLSRFPKEDEVLFQPSTSFKVIDILSTEDPQATERITITLEEVDIVGRSISKPSDGGYVRKIGN
ncbi:MAG: ADP-ribosyltransferase domain-containing protein [Bdellovibrionia bacterium]